MTDGNESNKKESNEAWRSKGEDEGKRAGLRRERKWQRKKERKTNAYGGEKEETEGTGERWTRGITSSEGHGQPPGGLVASEDLVDDQGKAHELQELRRTVRLSQEPLDVPRERVQRNANVEVTGHGIEHVRECPETEGQRTQHVPVPAGVVLGPVRDVVASGTLEMRERERRKAKKR